MHWEFRFTPTESEQLQALACLQGRLLRSARSDWRTRAWTTTLALLGGVAGFITIVYGDTAGRAAGAFFLYGMLGALLMQALYSATLSGAIRRTAIAADPALFTGPRSLRFDEQNVVLAWECGEMRFAWKAATGLERQGNIQLLLAGAHYLMLPDRLFSSDEQRQEWSAFVLARLSDMPAAAVRPSLLVRLGGHLFRTASTVFDHLWAGMNMLVLRPAPVATLRSTPKAVLMLVTCWVAMHLVADLISTDEAGQFTPDGLPGLLFPLALLALAGLVATAIGGNAQTTMLPILAALLTLLLPLGAIVLANQLASLALPEDHEDYRLEVARLAAIWLALAGSVAVARLAGFNRIQRITLLLGYLLVLAAPLAWVQPFDAIWSAPDERSAAYDFKYEALTREDAFYRQPQLLGEALSGLQPQNPDATDLYFVGVGGDAEQGVFLREVRSVEQLMDEQFATADHSIVLINNYRAAMDYPIATVTALERSLQRVAQLMDREQDILFLYLTSHGSRDHEFVLDFWPLKFKPLNPAVLKQMLDSVGIRWKVLVVSACYSGGYIEPLRDPHTIVITAAAADKTSFGCSDENDWTYFGRAFFQQALVQNGGDLDQAFAKARQIIAERESEEGIDEASDPQIATGPDMLRKWREFLAERQIDVDSNESAPE
jgi:hypothetical protein